MRENMVEPDRPQIIIIIIIILYNMMLVLFLLNNESYSYTLRICYT